MKTAFADFEIIPKYKCRPSLCLALNGRLFISQTGESCPFRSRSIFHHFDHYDDHYDDDDSDDSDDNMMTMMIMMMTMMMGCL